MSDPTDPPGSSAGAGFVRPLLRFEPLLSALLIVLSAALTLHHVSGDSATADEPVHLTSAAEIVLQGTGRWNPEHPPLAKALAGLALAGLDPKPPGSPFDGPHVPTITAFVFQNRVSPESLLFRARLPFTFLLVLLLLAVRAEAARRFGPLAGLLAVLMLAFEPNTVAHAGVVHTDLAVTLFLVASLGPLARVVEDPSWRSTLLLGLLWGLAFLSKYSAPLLVAATLPLLVLERPSRSLWPRLTARVAAAAALALLVTLLGFWAACRNQTAADRDALANDRLLTKGRSPAAARLSLDAGRLSGPLENLLTGTLSIALQSEVGGGVNYFLGNVSPEGSPLYFPVALLAKASVGLLLAALLGAAASKGRGLAVALALGLGLFVLVSARSTYNIGVRHVLFAFPFFALAASASAAVPSRRALAAFAFGLLQVLETASVHPFEMSFVNVAAGGLSGGHRLFVDSNVDWGQDLARLAKAAPLLSKEPLPSVVFSGDRPQRYFPALRNPAPGDELRAGALIAIGEAPLALGPELLASKGATRDAELLGKLREALRTRGRRVASIGGSIGIWRLE